MTFGALQMKEYQWAEKLYLSPPIGNKKPSEVMMRLYTSKFLYRIKKFRTTPQGQYKNTRGRRLMLLSL
jgi:hypothetical protein